MDLASYLVYISLYCITSAPLNDLAQMCKGGKKNTKKGVYSASPYRVPAPFPKQQGEDDRI